MQSAILLLALPLAAAQLYTNGTSQVTSSKTSGPAEVTSAPTTETPISGQSAGSSSSEDQTTYVTVVEGKTLTLTTHHPKSSQAPAPTEAAASSSQDQTTYVTVVEGKTLTLTTHKPTATPTPPAPQAPGLAPTSNDQTTYVTVVQGRTLTLTSQKPSPTNAAVVMANEANPAAVAMPLAAFAGAAAAMLL